MDTKSFNHFRKIIYKKSGISLGPSKIALVSARIRKRMRSLGIEDYREYHRHLTADKTGDEIIQLLDVISTNVTNFFRQPDHFKFIEKYVKENLQKGQRRFRFWSAACSTGEEPYSLAMTLVKNTNGYPLDLKVLATDISLQALETGVKGIYEESKIQRIPRDLQQQHFEPTQQGTESCYRIREHIKKLVLFKRLNLSDPPFPMRGPFDAVLCCNVLIYFDEIVRIRLLKEISRLLKPGGYLLIGYSETIGQLNNVYKAVNPSIYQKI